MFVVLLRFSENKALAPQHMTAHKAWIDAGFKDGVFALVGSLQPTGGGGILAYNTTREELDIRLADDPFVAHGIVSADITEIATSRAHEPFALLT
jgi:uncharacterized protein YciI